MSKDPLHSDRPTCKEEGSETEERKDDRLPAGHIRRYFGSIKDETFVLPEDRPYSPDYPEGFFDLSGSLEDDPLEVPKELPWSLDAPRKPL